MELLEAEFASAAAVTQKLHGEAAEPQSSLTLHAMHPVLIAQWLLDLLERQDHH